jgi:hypothetical protein
MNDTKILVLGRDANEIGDNLEVLATELFAELGFGAFVRNVYKTGAEIDLRARHRVTGAPLLCECKARARAMGTDPVKHFFSEWVKERASDQRLHGIMVSTSGFTGTAQQWWEELDDETRQCFTLMGPNQLLAQLVDADFTLAPRAIEVILTQRHSLGEMHSRYLTYSEHGLAWIYIYETNGKPRYHTVINGQAEPLPTWKCQEIAKLCKKLPKTDLFGLDLRRRIQVELLKNERQAVADIAVGARESETDVLLSLNALLNEGRIQKAPGAAGDPERFAFVRDVVPFVNIAKSFLHSEDDVVFLSSEYTQTMLNSPELITYVDSRHHLGMLPDERETVAQLLSISPSALRYALFGDADRYIKTAQDIAEKIADPDQRQSWLDTHRTSLLRHLVPYAVRDVIDTEHSLSSHLSRLGIKRYGLSARIDAIGMEWKLSAQGFMFGAIEKIRESISAGSLVSSSDPIGHMLWDGLLFLEVGQLEWATDTFLRARELCHELDGDKKMHQAVLSNLSVALMRQERWKEAVEFLDEALALGDPEFAELETNRTACLEHLGATAESEQK